MKRMGILLSFGLALLFHSTCEARVFIVTDTADSANINSLRGAIIAANRLGGRNVILLRPSARRHQSSPAIFQLTISGSLEDHAASGDLDITSEVAIMGSGSNTVIDATGLGDRIFQVFPGARLTLSSLTLRGGNPPGADSPAFSRQEISKGGAIYNAGSLELQQCVLTNNAGGDGTANMGNGGGNAGGGGGAIYNSGTLSMNDCIIVGNSCGSGFDGAEGGDGGGIQNDGKCVLNRCFIMANRSGAGGAPIAFFSGGGGFGGRGAGIFNTGTMLLTKCVVNENLGGRGADGGAAVNGSGPGSGGPGGWGGRGGGIYSSGTMEISYSSIYGNVTGSAGKGGTGGGNGGFGGIAGLGGGIANIGTLTMSACTVSSNLCGNGGDGADAILGLPGNTGGGGGGIYNEGPLTLTSCTIVLNRTGNGGNGGLGHPIVEPPLPPGDGGNAGDGGGILNDFTNGVTIRDTLIALNTLGVGGQPGTNILTLGGTGTPTILSGNAGAPGTIPDTFGDFTSGGFNLVGIGDGSQGFSNGQIGDIIGSSASPIDPLLAPLEMNGGPTPTHALLPGSPAIDQGNSFKIKKDQRGFKRRFDDPSIPNAIGGDGSDIGAFELSPPKKRN